jgi:hypothetical protein
VLKITRTETAAEEKWTLHGRLVGLWVSELRRCWKKTHRSDNNLKCIVDLNDVTCNSSLAVSTSSICFNRGVKDETTKGPNCVAQIHRRRRQRGTCDRFCL